MSMRKRKCAFRHWSPFRWLLNALIERSLPLSSIFYFVAFNFLLFCLYFEFVNYLLFIGIPTYRINFFFSPFKVSSLFSVGTSYSWTVISVLMVSRVPFFELFWSKFIAFCPLALQDSSHGESTKDIFWKTLIFFLCVCV